MDTHAHTEMDIELIFVSNLPYIIVFLNISLVLLFIFTIYNAKIIVRNKQNNKNDFEFEIKKNDNKVEEDGNSNIHPKKRKRKFSQVTRNIYLNQSCNK